MAKYVVELKFDQDNEQRMKVRPDHREYLHRLFAEGRLVSAGPYKDDSGAVLIYEVSDETVLKDILNNDPYFASDPPSASIVSNREWSPILP